MACCDWTWGETPKVQLLKLQVLATKDAALLDDSMACKVFARRGSYVVRIEQDPTTMAVMQAWKNGDFLCKNYILNDLDKTLYNVFNMLPTTKLL